LLALCSIWVFNRLIYNESCRCLCAFSSMQICPPGLSKRSSLESTFLSSSSFKAVRCMQGRFMWMPYSENYDAETGSFWSGGRPAEPQKHVRRLGRCFTTRRVTQLSRQRLRQARSGGVVCSVNHSAILFRVVFLCALSAYCR
jgi:hypothetical protein